MSEIMDAEYETSNDRVALVTTICNHRVIFREIWFTVLEPSHICAYVRLTPPFRDPDNSEDSDFYEYSYETYRDEDVFGVDTAHFHNRNQNMTQKLEDARWQITELIQEHLEWQAEQNVEPVPVPEPEPPVKQQPICVRRFLNLEL